jgi:selenocysteine-specific elongation factor
MGSATSSRPSAAGIIVGTAGHVDHGKTELIKALTGVDTDRLEEEKRRGLTIDLGFAPLDLPTAGRVGIVDVPGHHRFLKNMLAGVGGIDLALLVVAADEGIMPQTREHFEILHLLGVKNLLVAVTKVDTVEPDLADLVVEEVLDLLKGSPLEGSPIQKVSSVTREGLEELVGRLDQMVSALPLREPGPHPRLPIDRIFILQGIGTVITGSLTHGSISQGDEVVIYPRGQKARVRQIQVHNRQQERVNAGHRVALNIAGVESAQLSRGDVISHADAFQATRRLDVKLHTVDRDQIIKDWTRVRLYLGSAELLARVAILSAKEVRGGEEAFCQLRLESPTAAWYGDRFIIRRYSPPHLLGGGTVLNPIPSREKRFDPIVLRALETRERGGLSDILQADLSRGPLSLEDLAGSLSLGMDEIRSAVERLGGAKGLMMMGSFLIRREDLKKIEAQLISLVSEHHRRHPLKKGVSKEELKGRISAPSSLVEEILSSSGSLEVAADVVQEKGRQIRFSPEQERQREQIEDIFREAQLSPPDKDEVLAKYDPKVFYAMVKQGTLIGLNEQIYLHRKILEQAKEQIGRELSSRGGMRLGEMKDTWGTTRKFAVPLAEYLDRIGFTQREGDKRSLIEGS